MIITCEQCQKRYLVKDEEIGAEGRRVRCVGCNNRWFQKPPESLKEIALDPIQPENTNSTSTQEQKSYSAVLFLVSLIVFTVSLSYLARFEIVKMWPQTAQYYETLGITVSQYANAMKLSNIQPIHLEEGNQNTLIIRGDVMNTSKDVQSIPPVKIELIGPCKNRSIWATAISTFSGGNVMSKDQCVLKEWQHSFAESRLLPGEKITFETEPKATLADATNFKVHF